MSDEGIAATALDPRVRRGLAGALLALLAAVVLLNSFGRTPIDIKPEVYLAPWRSAASYLSSWQADPQLGFPSFNVGLAPVAALVGILQLFGVSAGVSAQLLRGLLAAVTAWGTARLYRSVVDERDDVGALGAAVVAVANPYTLVAGSTLAISLPLALLPWQLLAVVWAVRRGGWRFPAAFAVSVFAMSGANAGVVPVLQGLAVPVTAFWIAHHERLSVRRALAALARCLVLALLVSLYWIVPALSATSAGTTVLSNSESLDGIANVSSFAEVLRGLGLWPMYGSGPDGPWQPQFTAYLDNPVVLTASFAVPVLLALAVAVTRGGAYRRFALWLVVPAVVVMVGLNPVTSPTPFGRALRYVFVHSPATGAFRTTNKIGAMFVMGLALLMGAGIATALRRSRTERRPWYAAALALVLAAGIAPAFTGNLYTSFVDVPSYWRQAATKLNSGSSERVWFVPGEVQSHYRWSDPRPDDLSLSLLDRPSLVRTVIPVTGTGAANLLAAVDTGLQEGTLAPGTLSTAARVLGVNTLLLRNDQVWEDDGGARPAVLQNVINDDPGLRAVRNYGQPGQYTTPDDVDLTPSESALPPLQQWAVSDPQPVIGAQPADRTLLVSGDGYALDELGAAGLEDGTAPIRYLGDVRDDGVTAFRAAVAGGGPIVLTDTNRRRTTSATELTDGQGPLLPASADPGDTRSLGSARDQTVLTDLGGSVTASQDGSVFGPLPYAAPENAFDGDPATSWQFGDFGTGKGASLTARFTERDVPSVTVHTDPGNAHITRLRLTLGRGPHRVARTVPVDATGLAHWTPPAGTRADSFTLRVGALGGTGFNRQSLSAVDIPGLRITRVASLPRTLDALTDRTGVGLLDRTPIDLTFARVIGNVLGDDDDEESQLQRDFRLPVGRDYRVSGSVLVRGRVPDATLDRLAGAAPGVRVTGTSRLFDNPDFRASYALDGNPDTAWTPGIPATGDAITVHAPARPVSQITLDQTVAPGTVPNAASRVDVLLDGKVVRRGVRADVGTTTIRVPRQRASTLTLRIAETLSTRRDAPVHITEIGFGGAQVHDDPARAARACVSVGTLDGQPLRVHPAARMATGAPVPVTPCGTLALPAGRHRLRAAGSTFTPNRLSFADELVAPARHDVAPTVRVTARSATGATVRVTGGYGAYWLGLGQALDPRWSAQLDGHPLGGPRLLDGWQAGWGVVADGRAHTVSIRYGPQRAADVALGVSAVALLGCGVLALGAGRWLRGRRLRRPGWVHRPGWVRRPAWARRAERVRSSRPARSRPQLGPGASLGVRLVAAAAVAWLFGGWPALATVAVLAGYARLRPVTARGLALASAVAFAVVPALWGLFRPDGVPAASPAVIVGNPWPGRAALVGLVLLVAAVLRDDDGRRSPA